MTSLCFTVRYISEQVELEYAVRRRTEPAQTRADDAEFVGSWQDTTLTVSSVTTGSIAIGTTSSGEGIAVGTTISGLLSGTGSAGTYCMSSQQPADSAVESLGFSENACRHAVAASGNLSVEEAMQWLLANRGNPELNRPFIAQVVSGSDCLDVGIEGCIGRSKDFYANHQEEAAVLSNCLVTQCDSLGNLCLEVVRSNQTEIDGVKDALWEFSDECRSCGKVMN